MKEKRIFVLLLVLIVFLTGCSAAPQETMLKVEKEPIQVVELSTPIETLQETVAKDISLYVEDLLLNLSTAQMVGESELVSYLEDFFQGQGIEAFWDHGYVDEKTGNIAAVIQGEPNLEQKAIVFTAYYESYDQEGKIEYDGSGVAALMHTLSYIQSYLGENKPAFDMIFAFVNAEENRNQASLALAAFCAERYQELYQIHYEHVAEIGAGPLLLDTETELYRILPQGFMGKLKGMGVACSDGQKDAFLQYNAFSALQFPSVVIEQASHFQYDKIMDTPADLLDDQNIDRIAKSVAQFVRDDGNEMFQQLKGDRALKMDVTNREWQVDSMIERELRLAGRGLAYDERMPFVYDGVLCYATGYRSFVSMDDLHQYYPQVQLPKKLEDYRLAKIDVINANQLAEPVYYEVRDVDWLEEWERLGKIETIELIWEDVVGLQVEYYDEAKDEYLLLECYQNGTNPPQTEIFVKRNTNSAYYVNNRRKTDLFEGLLVQKRDWIYRLSSYPKVIMIDEGKAHWSKKRILRGDSDERGEFLKSKEDFDQLAEEIDLNRIIDGLNLQLRMNQAGLLAFNEEAVACVRMGRSERCGEERHCPYHPYGTDVKYEKPVLFIQDNGNMLLEKEIDWECHGHI